jgi:hypothetical protein
MLRLRRMKRQGSKAGSEILDSKSSATRIEKRMSRCLPLPSLPPPSV